MRLILIFCRKCQGPMAISLGFGVLFSTAIILFMVPSLFMVLEDFSNLMYRKAKTDETDGSDAAGRPQIAG